MKQIFSYRNFVAVAAIGALSISCSENSDITPPKGPEPEKLDGKYVVVATAGGENAANYVLTADSLNGKSITVVGKGTTIERNGMFWVTHENGYLFSLVAKGGSTWDADSYTLDKANGEVKRKYKYDGIVSDVSYGILGDDLVTLTSKETESDKFITSEDGKTKYYAKNFIHTWLSSINGEIHVSHQLAENFVGNGEAARFLTTVEAGGKVYAPLYMEGMTPYGIKTYADKVVDKKYIAPGNRKMGGMSIAKGEIPVTQHPDKAWVAVFNSVEDFKNLKNPTIVETDKMSASYCGSWSNPLPASFATDDDGYVYFFSSGDSRFHNDFKVDVDGDGKTETPLPAAVGTKASSVMRIKAGTAEFDSSFGVVDLEKAGLGAYRLSWASYMSDHNFLLAFNDDQKLNSMSWTKPARHYAIFNGKDKSLEWIKGLPAWDAQKAVPSRFGPGTQPFTKDGVTYFVITTTDAKFPVLYEIDGKTKTAKKGMTIEADDVAAIGFLKNIKE